MKRFVTLVGFLAAAGPAHAAVVAAPGYAVHSIPTPATVQGGVVRRGEVILVGQGAFGGGMESIVRLDESGATTVATGFNSLGGFDLDEAGTLYAVDNCGECMGATTGDTLFAIPEALTRTTAVAAAGREVLPAGTIPFAADVLIDPMGAALVSDAVGGGAGRVVRVVSGTASNLIEGLDLVGGLALAPDGTLRVVNAVLNPDFTTTGAVLEYRLDGVFQGTLVGGLQGGFGAVVDREGNVLVSGVGSFGASKVIAVAPDGSVTDRATGFAFSSDLYFDAPRDEVLVLDFGVAEIVAICRDTDGDGVCDADDPCTGGATAELRLTIGRLSTPPGDDILRLSGAMTVPPAPVLDPVTTGVRVLVDGVAGSILDATVPGGAFDPVTRAGWKAKNGKFRYKDRRGSVLGITRIMLATSSKTPGRVSFFVAGRKGSYAVEPADLPLRATLVVGAGAGQCGDTTFSESDCSFSAAGNTLECGQ